MNAYRDIFKAIKIKDIDTVTRILDSGIDINSICRDNECSDPLVHCAAQRGALEILDLLLSRGADPNIMDNKGCTVLMEAIMCSTIDAVKIIMKYKADINKKDNQGYTAIAYATDCDDPDLIKLLYDLGANINIQDMEGKTPLMDVVRDSNIDLCRLFLDCGADPNIQDDDGWTALMYESCPEIAELLLDHGVDPDIRNYNGDTAHSVAGVVSIEVMNRYPRSLYLKRDRSREYMASQYHDIIVLV